MRRGISSSSFLFFGCAIVDSQFNKTSIYLLEDNMQTHSWTQTMKEAMKALGSLRSPTLNAQFSTIFHLWMPGEAHSGSYGAEIVISCS